MIKMGDENIKDKKLEYEIAHCAQQLHKNEESLRYYRLYLKNNKEQLSDDVIDNVYKNVIILYDGNNKEFNKELEGFKTKGNGNKHKELELFVEWMNNKPNVK